jgi:hypothetical protein
MQNGERTGTIQNYEMLKFIEKKNRILDGVMDTPAAPSPPSAPSAPSALARRVHRSPAAQRHAYIMSKRRVLFTFKQQI